MVYLVLSIICSALLSVIMRISENKKVDAGGMLLFNYLACTFFAVIFTVGGYVDITESTVNDMPYMFLLGAIGGLVFMVAFVLLKKNTATNGMVLAAIFMKLGLIIPVIMAIFVFGETPGMLQILGLVIGICAIVVINATKDMGSNFKNIFLLILLLVTGGFADSMINVYDKTGNPALSNMFLASIFAVASICALIMIIMTKSRLSRWDVVFGIILGIPNYFSSKFLLRALSDVPAVVAYPVFSVSSLILVSIIGLLIFKEQLTGQKAVGFALVIVALVLLQVS